MLKTRPEDDSVNRTLKLEIDPDTLLGTVHAADCVCAFKITACSDENDELVPEDCLSQRLSAVVNASFVSIVTMDKDEIRVLLDVPIIHGWGLFEVFGRALDKNANHSLDIDAWTVVSEQVGVDGPDRFSADLGAAGQMLPKCWSNTGQTLVKYWPNAVRNLRWSIPVKYRSNTGPMPVKGCL